MIIWLGAVGGCMKVYSDIFRIKLAADILTEMSIGASHSCTEMVTQFSISSTVWIPDWKNITDNLQSERIPRMRTSLSERGSGQLRLAFGRPATRLTPRWSISRRRRQAPCNGNQSATHKTQKQYALWEFHDFVWRPKPPADPATSASETEGRLVPKSGMREWHRSLQALIVQAQGKSWTRGQNLPEAGIEKLPLGHPHTVQHQYRRTIPKMAYAKYPNYKEHSRAVKKRLEYDVHGMKSSHDLPWFHVRCQKPPTAEEPHLQAQYTLQRDTYQPHKPEQPPRTSNDCWHVS